jgi:hypothetical protein
MRTRELEEVLAHLATKINKNVASALGESE